jgi:moderate conductance mechanosensitive channel
MQALQLAVLSTLGDILSRLSQIFRIDGEAAIRYGVRIVVIWVLAWLAYRLVRLAAQRIEQAVDDGDDSVTTLRERRGKTISQLLRSVGRVVIVLIALLVTLNMFINVGPVLAGAGILGLAVSFGAQSLVKDIISGFFILSENQFAVGDVIEAAGKSGVVEKMTLRVVVLRDLEGRMHIVPNGEIKVVSNMTRGWSRAVVDLTLSYQQDVDRALAVIKDEAAQFSTDRTWSPQLDGALEVPGVEALDNTGVRVRTLIRTQPGSQWNAAREFRLRLLRRLEREGIAIPVAQPTIRLKVEGVPAAQDVVTVGGAHGG